MSETRSRFWSRVKRTMRSREFLLLLYVGISLVPVFVVTLASYRVMTQGIAVVHAPFGEGWLDFLVSVCTFALGLAALFITLRDFRGGAAKTPHVATMNLPEEPAIDRPNCSAVSEYGFRFVAIDRETIKPSASTNMWRGFGEREGVRGIDRSIGRGGLG